MLTVWVLLNKSVLLFCVVAELYRLNVTVSLLLGLTRPVTVALSAIELPTLALAGCWLVVMIVGVSVSVAELLAGLLSVTPAGVVAVVPTVAVLTRLPVAEGEICATSVKVTVAPGTRLTRSLTMLPVPLDVTTLAPAVATAVQVAEVMAAGSGSLTAAPVTADGPLLLTTMV